MVKVIVIGSLLMDLVVILNICFGVGEIVLGELFKIVFGGKGVN